MIGRLRDAGLLWPGLASIVAFCALVVLGNWQWERMHWKEGLLQQLEEAAKAEPVWLPKLLAENTKDGVLKLERLQFRRVRHKGQSAGTKYLFVWAPSPEGPAWSVIVPMRIAPLGPKQYTHVFVILGDIAADRRSEFAEIDAAAQSHHFAITGRIRTNKPNTWAPEANIERNEWFTRDIKAMSAQFDAVHDTKSRFLPFFIESLEFGLGGPRPNLKAINLSNRHFEYALTWWGLAATLVGVFAAFAWGRINSAKS